MPIPLPLHTLPAALPGLLDLALTQTLTPMAHLLHKPNPNSTPNRRLIRRGLGIAGRGRGMRLCLLAFEASCLAQRSRQLAGVYWSLPRPLSWCADPTATLRLPSPFWSARHAVSSLTADLMPYVAENNFTG